MASHFVLIAAIQAIVIQVAYSQCVNRVVPNCAQNVLPVELLQNQLLLSQPGLLPAPIAPTLAPLSPAIAPIIPGLGGYDSIGYAPTVIQDSSVANSLANALQLLVVSNLLSNTLPGFPGTCDVIPNYAFDPCVPSYPAYNYIY